MYATVGSGGSDFHQLCVCHSLSSVNNVSSVLGGSSVMVPWCFLVLFSSPKEVMPFMKTKQWKWVFGHLSSDFFLFFCTLFTIFTVLKNYRGVWRGPL